MIGSQPTGQVCLAVGFVCKEKEETAMRTQNGYAVLLEAAAQASDALRLDDVDACVIQDACSEMDNARTRRSFEKFALRFDRAFHGLTLSGYAVAG
jgi:hypothetical protein